MPDEESAPRHSEAVFRFPYGQKENHPCWGWFYRWFLLTLLCRFRGMGISHELKSVHRTLFAPVCGLVPLFRFPYGQKEKPPLLGWFFFLVTRTGIEPMLPP